MLSIIEIERIFPRLTRDQLDCILEIRNLVLAACPLASESVHSKGLTYFDASRGGHVSAGICQVIIDRSRLKLAFIHGSFLPDPRHLLEGDRLAKRFLPIHSYDQAPWDEIKRLITDSCNFDPYTQQFRHP